MTISDLDFADDICPLEDDFNAAPTLLSSVIAAAAKIGLIITAKKRKQCSQTTPPKTWNVEMTCLKMWAISTTWRAPSQTTSPKKRNCQSHHQLEKIVQLREVKQHLHKLEIEALPNVLAKYPAVREWELEPNEIRHQCYKCIWKHALADLLAEVTCRRTHTFEPMANLAYQWKFSSKIGGSSGQDTCCEFQRKYFLEQPWNSKRASHGDVHANNHAERLWWMILKNTLDHATSPNRNGTKIGRKSASRRQVTELSGVLF